METRVDEIADGIYRLSTFVSDAGLAFNQYVIDGDEPFLFHLGLRNLFPLASDALSKVMPADRLRWMSGGHFEADEYGGMSSWLAAAPQATVAHGATAVLVSLNDMADRPPRVLADGEVIDLGGKRVRYLDTPHVPHGWDAGLFYEETTGTLLCGDLFTQQGDGPALIEGDDDLVGPALAAEDLFKATSFTPLTAPTIRKLADLAPSTLALMHGPAYRGDGGGALRALADDYERRLGAAAG